MTQYLHYETFTEIYITMEICQNESGHPEEIWVQLTFHRDLITTHYYGWPDPPMTVTNSHTTTKQRTRTYDITIAQATEILKKKPHRIKKVITHPRKNNTT